MAIMCEVCVIDRVEKHPDADTLDIVYFGDFKTISRIGQFQVGDYGIYLATACILPEDLLRKINMWDEKNNCGLLGGNKGDRIKPKKLRGIVSEGIMYGPHTLLALQQMTGLEDPVGAEMKDILGVTKYDPNIFDKATGRKLGGGNPRSCFNSFEQDVHTYDIENIKKHRKNLEEYFASNNIHCVVTEKIHGCASANTLVQTFEHGTIPIHEIVDKQLKVHVLSYNENTGEQQYRLVTHHQELPNNDDWYEVITESGQKVILTGEHPVYLPKLKVYRRVDQLEEGDEVLLDQ